MNNSVYDNMETTSTIKFESERLKTINLLL